MGRHVAVIAVVGALCLAGCRAQWKPADDSSWQVDATDCDEVSCIDETCDEADPNRQWFADVDGDTYGDDDDSVWACEAPDGYVGRYGDCDDTDPAVRPGQSDRCDGVDGDCDGAIDEGASTTVLYLDLDGDGYGIEGKNPVECSDLENYSAVRGDCDDEDSEIYPGAAEACDEADNDCDDAIDEGC